MKSAAGKISLILLSLFLILYVGFQVWQFFYDPYKTEIAVRYSVSETVRVKGIAVRTEELVPAQAAGSVSYAFDDAAKVLKNTCIAYTHASSDTVENGRRAGELEREIELLREADATVNQGYGTSDLLNQQIGKALIDMAEASDGDRLDNVAAQRESLLLLLNKKQILIGEETGYAGRIAELENEKAVLLERISSDSEKAVNAPSSGYFISVVDGFEELVNKETLFTMSVKDVESLIDRDVNYSGSAIAKIADDYNWYYAAAVTPDDAPRFRQGMQLTAAFDGVGDEPVELTVADIIADDTSKNTLIVFSCEHFTPAVASLRQTGAELMLSNFSGLRVSDEAVRYSNSQERGVYVLDRGTVRFKTIDVIYEGLGYKLCKWQQGAAGTLQVFDEVFVRGADLYDGKSIE